MSLNLVQPLPILSALPLSLPREGAIEVELEQGVLIFRVSEIVQERIETLLHKQRAGNLTGEEAEEIRQYEEIDDYLSYLNRLIRNPAEMQRGG